MITSVQCAFCTHYFAGKLQCTAYPEGIPKAILEGDADHRLPYPGDHGIRLKLKPGLSEGVLGPLLELPLEKAS